MLSLGSEGVAGDLLQTLGDGSELFNECIIYSFLKENTRRSCTYLTRVKALNNIWLAPKHRSRAEDAQNTRGHPFHSLLDVRIVEDNTRAFPSEFKSDRFQIRFSRCFLDLSSHQGTTSECDLGDIGCSLIACPTV